MYIHELSASLNKIKSECIFNDILINNIIYINNIAVLAPSWKGQQELTNICALFGKLFHVNFNSKKSKCIKFNLKSNITINSFSLNGVDLENVANFQYLGDGLTNVGSLYHAMREKVI